MREAAQVLLQQLRHLQAGFQAHFRGEGQDQPWPPAYSTSHHRPFAPQRNPAWADLDINGYDQNQLQYLLGGSPQYRKACC